MTIYQELEDEERNMDLQCMLSEQTPNKKVQIQAFLSDLNDNDYQDSH